jgi:uncharacterized protein (TIGR02145 family)
VIIDFEPRMKSLIVIIFCFSAIYCSSCDKVSLPDVRTLSWEMLTLDTVELTGEVTENGGLPITKRGFCWATIPNPTLIDHSSENQTGPGVFTEKVGGLTCGQVYYFRSYASNADGFEYGNVLSFQIDLVPEKDTLKDSRDGKRYLTVKIGDQVWMAENLAFLPSVSLSSMESDNAPFCYVYDYEGESVEEAKTSGNYRIHGALYNLPAALAACPPGWHLPSDDEWTALTNFLGSYPGGKLKQTGTINWKYNSPGANNISGFTALGSGVRKYHVDFFYLHEYAYFWSSTPSVDNQAWYRRLNDVNDNVFRAEGYRRLGQSVRCVKD